MAAFWKVNYYWRDTFFTSMIMEGTVFLKLMFFLIWTHRGSDGFLGPRRREFEDLQEDSESTGGRWGLGLGYGKQTWNTNRVRRPLGVGTWLWEANMKYKIELECENMHFQGCPIKFGQKKVVLGGFVILLRWARTSKVLLWFLTSYSPFKGEHLVAPPCFF